MHTLPVIAVSTILTAVTVVPITIISITVVPIDIFHIPVPVTASRVSPLTS